MANRIKKGKPRKSIKLLSAEEERLAELKREFIADWKADEPFRRDKLIYGDFYDGDQWEQDEIDELNRRGQPAVVNNRIKPKIDAILGITAEAKVDTKAFDKGDRVREDDISAISEEFRAIEDESNFDEQELLVFKDQLIDGRGWYKTEKRWDNLKYRLLTSHVDNANVVPDRFGTKADLSDHTRIHETVWKNLEDLKSEFPGHEEELEEAVNLPVPIDSVGGSKHTDYQDGDQYARGRPSETSAVLDEFVDKKQKRVRVVTTWYRRSEVRRFLLTPGQGGGVTDVTDMSEEDLEKVREMFPNAKEWSQPHKKLNVVTFTWNCVLEEVKDIKKGDTEARFPLVMVPGYTKRRNRQNYGLVKQHLDPQKEVNKRRSKMLHLLNTTETIFDEGAFEDEAKAREEFSQPDAWIKARQGFRVERVRHDNLAASQFQLLQESKLEIDSAGVNREIEGRSSASSGRDFQFRIKEALKSIRELLTNLREGRRRVAEGWLDDILERFPELSQSRYNVVIEEAPDTLTLTQETFATLAQLAQGGQVPIPPDILLDASPLAPKVKNQIQERMKQAEEQRAQMQQLAMAQQQQLPPEGET